MRITKALLLFLAGLFCLNTAIAQDDPVTGKWNLSVQTPQGPMEITFDLKAEGSELTGNMSMDMMPAGQGIPISEGTVDGNELAFKIIMQSPQGNMTINYTGVVEGDSMEITPSMEGMPAGAPGMETVTATRS